MRGCEGNLWGVKKLLGLVKMVPNPMFSFIICGL
jgi:hypothetical protein